MRRAIVVVAVLAASATVLPAGEIVFFKNGTTLPVQTHRVENDMIHVDLGRGSIMAFPLSMVERVEVGGVDVLGRSGDAPNRMVEGSLQSQEEMAFPVTGVIPPSERRGKWLGDQSDLGASNIEVNSTNGLTVTRPMADNPQPAIAAVKVTGSMAPLNVRPTGSSSQPGKIGTQRFGSGYRIGATAPAGKPMGVPFAARQGVVETQPVSDSATEAAAETDQPTPDAGNE
jgi:hypothetical protein